MLKSNLEQNKNQRKILLIGNPNVGKSTLFNSLTRSHEHTGNFHGVTVSEAKKVVEFENETLCFYDLPGIYSMLPFSPEEEVSKNLAMQENATRLFVVDANSLRRNLYLCLQFLEMGLDFKILINNYKYFNKNGNTIDVKKLSEKLNADIEIVNAKKQKITKKLIDCNKNNKNYNNFCEFSKNNLKYLKNITEKIKNKLNLSEKQIIFALNGSFDGLKDTEINYIKGFYTEIIEERYNYIDEILKDCVNIQKNYVYGKNKLDKLILNPFFMLFSFIFAFFLIFYLIFFSLGPLISDLFINSINYILINPFLNFLTNVTDNVWLIEFFSSGVFSSLTTITSGFINLVSLVVETTMSA